MLVGPSNVLFVDEISTGLDSSTISRVNLPCYAVHILQELLLSPFCGHPPETNDLFDDSILLSDGLMVCQGPRENVLESLHSMGFKCPQRKGIAEIYTKGKYR